jgi:hypothetical protein
MVFKFLFKHLSPVGVFKKPGVCFADWGVIFQVLDKGGEMGASESRRTQSLRSESKRERSDKIYWCMLHRVDPSEVVYERDALVNREKIRRDVQNEVRI